MSLQTTPNANRLHIGIFGKTNSGKSSLINAMTGQEAALVSDIPGTTTDPVFKTMELPEIGSVVFIDTAGYGDTSVLGDLRVQKTEQALRKTDIALLVIADSNLSCEKEWMEKFHQAKTPLLIVINKADSAQTQKLSESIQNELEVLKSEIVSVSAKTGQGIHTLLTRLHTLVPAGYDSLSITAHLVSPGDRVLLVMPQDAAAPKGRLILPQVQTMRDLLDRQCVIIGCTPETLDMALAASSDPPDLIITDSQVFDTVYEKKPERSKLTSFSVLMARAKGDISVLKAGAQAMDRLNGTSHVLIAEACTHAPVGEDIGRVKIPHLLRKEYGDSLQITVTSGADFPKDLSKYDLVIHCGGCMFHKKHMASRMQIAQDAGIPVTNYGIALAKLTGILDKIVL